MNFEGLIEKCKILLFNSFLKMYSNYRFFKNTQVKTLHEI